MFPVLTALSIAAASPAFASACNQGPFSWHASAGGEKAANHIILKADGHILFNQKLVDAEALRVLVDQIATLDPQPTTTLTAVHGASCKRLDQLHTLVLQGLGSPS